MIIFLYDKYNIFTSISAIEKALKRAKISHKKISISILLFLEVIDY